MLRRQRERFVRMLAGISTANGYLPIVGTTITIVTASNLTGTSTNVTGTQLSGRHWEVSCTPGAVTLKAVAG